MNGWALRKAEPDPHDARALECWLTNGGMTATVHLSGRGQRAYIVVGFSSTTTAVAARAEAHRFTAAALDEMVELEEENGVPCAAEITEPQHGRAFAHGREWVYVSLTGRNALEVIADYFGGALEDATDGPGPGR